MSTGGWGITPLIDHPAYDVNPVWSPDGRQIAFMSTRGYELGSIGPFPGHIYIVNNDGSGLRQVTHEPLTSSLGPSDWSADGRQLLMARVVDSSPSLFALTIASGRERQLFQSELVSIPLRFRAMGSGLRSMRRPPVGLILSSAAWTRSCAGRRLLKAASIIVRGGRPMTRGSCSPPVTTASSTIFALSTLPTAIQSYSSPRTKNEREGGWLP